MNSHDEDPVDSSFEEPLPETKPEIGRGAAGLLGCLGGFALGSFVGVVVFLGKVLVDGPSALYSGVAFNLVYVLSPIGGIACWWWGLRMWDRRWRGGPS